jgi:hypothetical protein
MRVLSSWLWSVDTDGGTSIVSVVSLGLALFLESKNSKDGALILANRTLGKVVAAIAATDLMATGSQDTIHWSFATNDALEYRIVVRKRNGNKTRKSERRG